MNNNVPRETSTQNTVNLGFYFNQWGVYRAGLAEKTDIADWMVIDYISKWEQNEQACFVAKDGVSYVWIDYTHLLETNPALPVRKRNALSKRFKKLVSLNLLESAKRGNKTFFRTTSLTRRILADTFLNACPVAPKQNPPLFFKTHNTNQNNAAGQAPSVSTDATCANEQTVPAGEQLDKTTLPRGEQFYPPCPPKNPLYPQEICNSNTPPYLKNFISSLAPPPKNGGKQANNKKFINPDTKSAEEQRIKKLVSLFYDFAWKSATNESYPFRKPDEQRIHPKDRAAARKLLKRIDAIADEQKRRDYINSLKQKMIDAIAGKFFAPPPSSLAAFVAFPGSWLDSNRKPQDKRNGSGYCDKEGDVCISWSARAKKCAKLNPDCRRAGAKDVPEYYCKVYCPNTWEPPRRTSVSEVVDVGGIFKNLKAMLSIAQNDGVEPEKQRR